MFWKNLKLCCKLLWQGLRDNPRLAHKKKHLNTYIYKYLIFTLEHIVTTKLLFGNAGVQCSPEKCCICKFVWTRWVIKNKTNYDTVTTSRITSIIWDKSVLPLKGRRNEYFTWLRDTSLTNSVIRARLLVNMCLWHTCKHSQTATSGYLSEMINS